ncbi:MAG: sigma-54-dependent Fis family transcriptional regulator [Planctomycetes bacterium]|nr:sigma-54-dependent Fis family transcriptional regulator [Planctomycetota bacterium]
MLGHVLLAIPDARLRARLRRTLSQADVLVEHVDNPDELWSRLARTSADMLVAVRSAIPDPATATIGSLRGLPDSPEVVVLDRHSHAEDRAQLLAAGAFAVLDEALSSHALRDVVTAILARRRSETTGSLVARRALPEPRLDDFITSSPAMKTFMELVHRVVASDTSLLILGETGVGKEHLARAIHAESPRATGPFIAVNCGALAETLLESELFGHEAGAFTGATRTRRGSFEMAHKGVVFLDEIGELPQHLQVKLLHVLQRREIQRLGGEAAIGIDVRIMAATNRDIAVDVETKHFRPDLYYRLSVVTLSIPPLRERRDDIRVLVDSYLDYFRGHIRRNVTGTTAEALAALENYPWPGNVRELVNILERAMLLVTGDRIRVQDLPAAVRNSGGVPDEIPRPAANDPRSRALPAHVLNRTWRDARDTMLADFEYAYLSALLHETGGRINETARRAGIEPRSLFDKLKRHGLRKETFRPGRIDEP